MAPLPVWCQDPSARLDIVREQMKDLKGSGQAVGAQVLTELTGYAPPTMMAQASRLMGRQRLFNLVVTNVPGPQIPLYLLGRRARTPSRWCRWPRTRALGIAIMSYDGRMNFGLVGDYDVMYDLDDLAVRPLRSLEELAEVAGVELATATPAGARVSS